MALLPWFALGPDMKPIENLWSIFSKAVYTNGRHFDAIDDLVDYIHCAWDNIDDEILHNLISSMPRRCLALVEAREGLTKYLYNLRCSLRRVEVYLLRMK